MRFRTEITIPAAAPIVADEKLVFLGSCFADNMSERLRRHGFDVTANPLGPLFNPASLAAAVERALDGRSFTADDLCRADGCLHCLDAAARYLADSTDVLLHALNRDFAPLTEVLRCGGCTLFATFGTAYVYEYRATGRIVANCHRLPADAFARRRMSVEEITAMWQSLLKRLHSRECAPF